MRDHNFIGLQGIAILILVMLNFSGLKGQSKSKNRKPAVAGQFYPGTEAELSTKIKELMKSAQMSTSNLPIRALIVPHAGYEFSGEVAAYGYKQLTDLSMYDNIFIIASSHRVSLGKASVYNNGDYITPMGTVAVNKKIGSELIKSEVFCFDPSAHSDEHSIEVQLPFLQQFNKLPPIIPIVVASHIPSVSEEIAKVLKPWFTPHNLFIISADFSHYPGYNDAITIDKLTAEALCSGSPDIFLKVLEQNEEKNIRGLATSMCAWPAALSLLYLCENDDQIVFEQLKYANSGDHKNYGDKKRVVGYHAIALRDKRIPQGFYLSNRDKQDLLELSRKTLDSFVYKVAGTKSDEKDFSTSLNQKAGAFVTLKIDHTLRGCLGQFDPSQALYELIPELTISSAARDTRFTPVRSNEVKDISIEISILTPMRKIRNINEIELGKHGIYIKKDGNSGTFLPQVATETGWTLEEFLGHCARDKAHIGYEGWKNADIYIYEAIIFKELR